MRLEALMAAEQAAEGGGTALPRTRSSDACHDSPTEARIGSYLIRGFLPPPHFHSLTHSFIQSIIH